MPAEVSGAHEFDKLTLQMSEIDRVLDLAPDEHKGLHTLALVTTYFHATEILADNPGLDSFYRTLGEAVLSQDETDIRHNVSVRHLGLYAERGLIPAESLVGLQIPEKATDYPYTQADFRAFSELFPPTPEEIVDKEPPEGSFEQQDLEEEVNYLDILEHLELKGLEPAQLAYVRCALVEHDGVDIKDIRTHEFDVLKLSKEAFDKFVKDLPAFRWDVRHLLKETGVDVRWEEVTVRRKRHYRLLIETQTEAEADNKSGLRELYGRMDDEVLKERRPRASRAPQEPVPAPPEPEDMGQDQLIELQPLPVSSYYFADKLLGFIRTTLHQSGEKRLNVLTRQAADAMNGTASKLEMREAISNLVQSEDLFWGPSEKGTRTIQLEKPTGPVSRRGNGGASKNETGKAAEDEFTLQDFILVGSICDEIIKTRSQTKGMTVPQLSRELGISEEQVKRLVSRAVSDRALVKEMRRIRTGSPRSKVNKQATFVMFPNQQAWNQYRENPGQYLAALRPVEASTD